MLGLVAAVLSLGVGNGYWAPWRLFVHLPVLNNVVPVNITAIVDLCVAVVLAVVIDKVRSSSRPRLGSAGRPWPGWPPPPWRWCRSRWRCGPTSR